jgi:neutral ceramidase
LELIKFVASLVGIQWPSKAEITPEYVEGHGAKPIFVHLGLSSYKGDPLVPFIMPLQLIKLGSLVIIAHPGELTTIAGIRLRETVLDILDKDTTGVKYAVAATYSNAYTSYTTTKEEYDMQHYEGASTLFGPWTLEAYRQENAKLARALKENKTVPKGPTPPNLNQKYRRRITGVPPEKEPIGKNFGDVERDQPRSVYQKGETVKVSFWGGHPNNHLKTNSTYLEIQKRVSGQWEQVFTDKDFCTIFYWQRRKTNFIIDLEWNIPKDQESGVYRICYHGHWKYKSKQIKAITGSSREFTIG